MTGYATHTWPDVIRHYRERAAAEPRLAAMRDFVVRVAASRYRPGLFPVTSHDALLLFQHDRFDALDEHIRVEFDGEFVVQYRSGPRQLAPGLAPIESEWTRRDADGFHALEQCLSYLRWFTDYGPASAHPTQPNHE
jgi:hypothetical protein